MSDAAEVLISHCRQAGQRITAPLLWVQGAGSRLDSHWGGRYSLAEFQQRLAGEPGRIRRARD